MDQAPGKEPETLLIEPRESVGAAAIPVAGPVPSERTPGAPSPQTKQDWLIRREIIRGGVRSAIGMEPAPPRSQLQIHLEPGEDWHGLVAHRVHWQCWRGVWISGRLALPPAEEPGGTARLLPAVLLARGASADWENKEVGLLPLSLARGGQVVLEVDRLALCRMEMSLLPCGVMAWALSRALDLLCSNPEVDRRRIGVVGDPDTNRDILALLAIDDRARAVTLVEDPSASRSGLPGELCSAVEEPIPGLLAWSSEVEVLGMQSPMPLQLISQRSSADGSGFDPNGPAVSQLRSLYRLWGQEDRLEINALTPDPDSPETLPAVILDFMARSLCAGAPATTRPASAPRPSAAEMVTHGAPPRDRLASSGDDGAADGIVEWFRDTHAVKHPQLEGKGPRKTYQEELRAKLKAVVNWADAPAWVNANLRPVGDSQEGIVRVSLGWNGAERVQGHLIPGSQPSAPVALILADRDTPLAPDRVLVHPVAAAFRAAGYALFIRDSRELLRHPDLRLRRRVAWGRPEISDVASEAQAAVNWLHGQPGIDPRGLAVIGVGQMGLAALLLSAFDPRIHICVADVCGATYHDRPELLPPVAAILTVADLPQIAALSAPRSLWLYNVPRERTGFSSRKYYNWTERMFQSLSDGGALSWTLGSLPDSEELSEWLVARLRRHRRG